jgi:hypothetical protein
MAMLVLNSVFERTWSTRAGNRPGSDYWATIIPQIKLQRPEFIFVAEAYWDLEWELQQQGFDFCYDKRLYDRLEKETAESVRLHLLADMGYQEKLVRFIENHDEPRALAAFSPPKNRAAAVAMATLPGAKLFHEGQLEGRTVRTPVFLGRRQPEPTDPDLLAFYRTLLNTACRKELRNGSWRLCEQAGWPGNESCRNLLSWCWRCEGEYHLIIVNLSDAVAQGQVRLPWDEISGTSWQMTDLFTGHRYERSGDEMRNPGLYVDLPPWGYHVMGRWLSME